MFWLKGYGWKKDACFNLKTGPHCTDSESECSYLFCILTCFQFNFNLFLGYESDIYTVCVLYFLSLWGYTLSLNTKSIIWRDGLEIGLSDWLSGPLAKWSAAVNQTSRFFLHNLCILTVYKGAVAAPINSITKQNTCEWLCKVVKIQWCLSFSDIL